MLLGSVFAPHKSTPTLSPSSGRYAPAGSAAGAAAPPGSTMMRSLSQSARCARLTASSSTTAWCTSFCCGLDRSSHRPTCGTSPRNLLRGARLRHRLGRGLTIGLDRLALDVALAHQPKGEDGAGEAEQRAEQQDVVQPGQESLVGGVGNRVALPRG